LPSYWTRSRFALTYAFSEIDGFMPYSSNDRQSSDPTITEATTASVGDYLQDVVSGGVVFLVALPLCLGIALASDAPLFSGLLAGIIGGLVVGAISGSHTSVSGPAAGLTAIVATQISALGSFQAFLLAVLIGGLLQIGFGIARAGALSAFFPSSVIKGLLAAIGVILILKELPHLVGHDSDPEGDMAFSQIDNENTFSEILLTLTGDIHIGALAIGFSSLALLVLWGRWSVLKKSRVPAPLIVVLFGVGMKLIFDRIGGPWAIQADHLVTVPVADSAAQFVGFLQMPDFSQLANPKVYVAGLTVALVASLETLLNLEAVDKLDTKFRHSPPSRELVAQGCGNVVAGLIGGLPVTSVIVRSSVNVSSGANSKWSAIFHGMFLLVCVAFLPTYLNLIPYSALAAILFVTGLKLASPKLFAQMWKEGRYQFAPFIITLLSIIFTDLLIGILIGLGVSLLFILNSNLRTPIRRIVETHLGGDVTHIELANQVSFLNRAALDKIFNQAPSGSRMLIDASDTDYIDPDVLSLIRDFKKNVAPARHIKVNLRGFRSKYQLTDDVQFADYSTRELKDEITAEQVLELLKEGNRRFRSGNRLSRDFKQQVSDTSGGQNPLAAVLSCIDSRVPAELVFDLGIGDIFSVRVAGNVVGTKSLGSIEYAVGVSGVKLVLVLGHTKCGAVTSSVGLVCQNLNAQDVTGCEHLQAIVEEISPSVRSVVQDGHIEDLPDSEQEKIVDLVAAQNVKHTVDAIMNKSTVIRKAVRAGNALVVGALYDVRSGKIEFFDEQT
jgi:carbonic anhydrase/SulP family sulfate permease